MSRERDEAVVARAIELMTHFYLSQGFMEAPQWDDIDADSKNGFIGLATLPSEPVALGLPEEPKDLREAIYAACGEFGADSTPFIEYLDALRARYVEERERREAAESCNVALECQPEIYALHKLLSDIHRKARTANDEWPYEGAVLPVMQEIENMTASEAVAAHLASLPTKADKTLPPSGRRG